MLPDLVGFVSYCARPFTLILESPTGRPGKAEALRYVLIYSLSNTPSRTRLWEARADFTVSFGQWDRADKSQFYNQDFPHGRRPVPFSWVTLYDFSREQRTWSCATGGSFADLTHLPFLLSCCCCPPIFYFYCKSSWNHCLYLSLLLPSMCFQDNPSKPSFPVHFSDTIFSKKLIEDFCTFSHLSFPLVLVTAWSAFSRNLFSLVFSVSLEPVISAWQSLVTCMVTADFFLKVSIFPVPNILSILFPK